MAISYPRQLDGIPMQAATFEILRTTQRTPFRSGAAQRVEIAPPRWVARFTTSQPRTIDEFDAWITFLDTLQGGLKNVRAGDPTRAFPAAHPGGESLGDWNGEGTLVSRSAFQLGVDTPRPDLTMSVGDHVALREDGKFALHRVTEAASSNGEGFITLAVEPAVLTNVFSTAAVVDFFSPRALFALDPDSVSADKSTDWPPIAFTLVQVLF